MPFRCIEFLCNFALLMKNVLSIGLVFLFFIQALLPNMDICCEIPKIPNLLEHYQEHQRDEDFNLWSFLNFHYGKQAKDTHHQQDSQDENLPFKGQPCCHGVVWFVPSFNTYSNDFHLITAPERRFDYQQPLHSEYRHSIFQPPRV